MKQETKMPQEAIDFIAEHEPEFEDKLNAQLIEQAKQIMGYFANDDVKKVERLKAIQFALDCGGIATKQCAVENIDLYLQRLSNEDHIACNQVDHEMEGN